MVAQHQPAVFAPVPVISISRSFASAHMLTHGGSGWILNRHA
jgi:hypothetical protein